MRNASIPFGARATALLSGRFRNARFLLTLMYVGILSIILILSSSVVFSLFSRSLDRRFEGRVPPPFVQEVRIPSPDEVRQDLFNTIVLVNSALLLVAGIASYWLAGRTLIPIQEAYERQRAFLSDASHELRTPLAILKTDLENLPQTGQVKSHLEEVDRMASLVDDLLTLSRLDEQAQKEVRRDPVDLVALVKKTADRFAPLAREASVDLRFLPTSIEFVAHTDARLLEHALGNIVKNAILYNKAGGSVVLSLTTDRQRAVVSVVDTGIGMAPDDAAKVFDRFYRVEQSRSRQTGGSGLGLSIVQSIVIQLGGEITFESELDKGTAVAIFLPIHSAS